MSKVCDQQVVALQLRHDVEQDSLRIRFVVGVDANEQPPSPASHVLTVVAQRLDYLFAYQYPDQTDFGDQGVRTFAVCDTGGFFQCATYFKFFLEQIMVSSRTEAEVLCELMENKEE